MNNTLKVDPKNSNLHIINDAPSNRTNLVVHNNDERSVLKLRRNTNSNLENDVTAYGAIYFERSDNQGVWTNSVILGGEDYILLATSNNGIIDNPDCTLTFRNGKLGIANTNPKHSIDTTGNISANKLYAKLCIPNITKDELETLDAEEGMFILIEKKPALFVNGSWYRIELGEAL